MNPRTDGHSAAPRLAEGGFTMVEIALSIAIVAFALVAIIGVLPTGLQVQRDNKEETIVNQDGSYLLEAIRNGGLGLNELTNYVEEISMVSRQPGGGRVISRLRGTRLFEKSKNVELINGRYIIGMLSTPTLQWEDQGIGQPQWVENRVVAIMRSISGKAADRVQDEVFRDNNVFTYQIEVTVLPYLPPFPADPAASPVEAFEREKARRLGDNLYEVRLHFRWPVDTASGDNLANYRVGRREKIFRTLISGQLVYTNDIPGMKDSLPLYQFQPSRYHRPIP